MALPALNPPKTLNKKLQSLNSPFFSFSKTASFPKITKCKKYPLITMSSQQQSPPPHVALTNNDHKEELMSAIKSSITNCLSETHLDLTVPQLKSKIRGKVIRNKTCILYSLLAWDQIWGRWVEVHMNSNVVYNFISDPFLVSVCFGIWVLWKSLIALI